MELPERSGGILPPHSATGCRRYLPLMFCTCLLLLSSAGCSPQANPPVTPEVTSDETAPPSPSNQVSLDAMISTSSTADQDPLSSPESSLSEPSSGVLLEQTDRATPLPPGSSPTSSSPTTTTTETGTTSPDEDETTFWGSTETETSEEDAIELTGPLSLPPDLVERLLTEELPSVRVRRLTPTECERLQGFPDGWTIASEEAMTVWGRSISTVLDGTSSDALARSRSSSGWDKRSGPSSRSASEELPDD